MQISENTSFNYLNNCEHRCVVDVIFGEYLYKFPNSRNCRVCSFLSSFYLSLRLHCGPRRLAITDPSVEDITELPRPDIISFCCLFERKTNKCNDNCANHFWTCLPNTSVVPHFHRNVVETSTSDFGLSSLRVPELTIHDDICSLGEEGCGRTPRTEPLGAGKRSCHSPQGSTQKSSWKVICTGCNAALILPKKYLSYFIAFILGQGRIRPSGTNGAVWRHNTLKCSSHIDISTLGWLKENFPQIIKNVPYALFNERANCGGCEAQKISFKQLCTQTGKAFKIPLKDKQIFPGVHLDIPYPSCEEGHMGHSWVLCNPYNAFFLNFEGEFSIVLNWLFNGSHLQTTKEGTVLLKNFCYLPGFDVKMNEPMYNSLRDKWLRVGQQENTLPVSGKAQMYRRHRDSDDDISQNSIETLPLTEEEYASEAIESVGSVSVGPEEEEVESREEIVTSELVINRSLFSRLGGVLHAGTGLVKNLHKVWDWPLEQVLGGLDKVGDGLRGTGRPNRNLVNFQTNEYARLVSSVDLMNEELKKSIIRENDHVRELANAFKQLDGFVYKMYKEIQIFQTNTLDNLEKISDWMLLENGDEDKVKAEVKPIVKKVEADLSRLQEQVNDFTKENPVTLSELDNLLAPKITEQVTKEMKSSLGDMNDKLDNISKKVSKLKAKTKAQDNKFEKIAEKLQKLEAMDSDDKKKKSKEKDSDLEEMERKDIPITNNPNIGGNLIIPKRDATMPRSRVRRQMMQEDPLSEVVMKADTKAPEVTPVDTMEVKEAESSSGRPTTFADQTMEVLRSEVQLGTFVWVDSNISGNLIAYLNFPEIIFERSPIHSFTYSSFQYFVCEGLHIHLDVTSPKGQGGLLWGVWDPLSTATKGDQLHFSQLLPFQRVEVLAGVNMRYTLRVPFESIQNHLSLQGEEYTLFSLGTLMLVPALKLISSAGKNGKATIRVSANFQNPRFKMLTVPHQNPMNIYKQQVNILGGGVHGNIIGKSLGITEAFVTRKTWVTSETGRVLSLNVHPSIIYQGDNFIVPSSLGMVAEQFKFWRGSLSYKFHFAPNMLTTGRMLILALPAVYLQEDLTAEDARTLGAIEYVLDYANPSIVIDIPYVGVADFHRINKNFAFDSHYHGEALKVRLHMFVSSPLSCEVGSVSSIEYMITAQPNLDFELKGPLGLRLGIQDFTLPQAMIYKSDPKLQSLSAGGDYKIMLSNYGNFLLTTLKTDTAFTFKVAPNYRQLDIQENPLFWNASQFVRWDGSLCYRFEAFKFSKTTPHVVKIWFIPEGETPCLTEWSGHYDYIPPTGINVVTWRLDLNPIQEITVPMCARYKTLLIPKSYLSVKDNKSNCYYNGSVCFSYVGDSTVDFRISVKAGEDLGFFDRSAMGKLGLTPDCVARVNYVKKLKGDLSTIPIQKEIFNEDPNQWLVNSIVNFNADPGVNLGNSYERADGRKMKLDDDRNFKEDKAVPQMYRESDESINFADSLINWEKVEEHNAKRPKVSGKSQMFATASSLASHALFGRKQAAQLHTENIVANINKINDPEKFNELLSVFTQMKDLDVKAFSEVMVQAEPLLKQVNTAEGKQAANDAIKGMPKICSVTGKMADIMDSILKFLEKFVTHSFPGFIMQLSQNKQGILAILATIVGVGCLYYWYKNLDAMSMMQKISALCTILWLPLIGTKVIELLGWLKEVLLPAMQPFVEKWQTKSGEAQSKSGVESSGQAEMNINGTFWSCFDLIIKPILFLSATLTSLLAIGLIPTKKACMSFADQFTAFGEKSRAITSIASCWKVLKDLATSFSEKVMSWIVNLRGIPKEEEVLMVQLAGFNVTEWVTELDEMSLEENKYKDVNSVEHRDQVRHLFDKAQALKKVMMTKAFPSSFTSIVNLGIKKATDLLNESHTSKGLGEFRVDPIHVCFYGDPGVGKSAILYKAMNDVLDCLDYPKVDREYSRSSADQYWSRYYNQSAVIMDDLGALIGSGDRTDVGELIGLKSNQPMSLNMASVEEKGRMFTSDFIFSTTNTPYLDDQSNVRCKEAFHRRRDILVKVTRDPMIPKNSQNPQQGLLFTVMDSKENNAVKTNWDEHFFNEREGFIIRNWTYDRFIPFLCAYTKLYLTNQHTLVATLKNREEKPLEVGQLKMELDQYIDRMESNTDKPAPQILDQIMFGNFSAKVSGEPQMVKMPNPELVCDITTIHAEYRKLKLRAKDLALILDEFFKFYSEKLVSAGKSCELDAVLNNLCECSREQCTVGCDLSLFRDRVIAEGGTPKAANYALHMEKGKILFEFGTACHQNKEGVRALQIVCAVVTAAFYVRKDGECPMQSLRNFYLLPSVKEEIPEVEFTGEIVVLEDGILGKEEPLIARCYSELIDANGGMMILLKGKYCWIHHNNPNWKQGIRSAEQLWQITEKMLMERSMPCLELKKLFSSLGLLDLMVMKSVFQEVSVGIKSKGVKSFNPHKWDKHIVMIVEDIGLAVLWKLLIMEVAAQELSVITSKTRTKSLVKEEAWSEAKTEYSELETTLLANTSPGFKTAKTIGTVLIALVGAGAAIYGVWSTFSWLYGVVVGTGKVTVDTQLLGTTTEDSSDEEEEEIPLGTSAKKQMGFMASGDQRTQRVSRIMKPRKMVRAPGLLKQMAQLVSGDQTTKRVSRTIMKKTMKKIAHSGKAQMAPRPFKCDGSASFTTNALAQLAIKAALEIENVPMSFLRKLNIEVPKHETVIANKMDNKSWQKKYVELNYVRPLPQATMDVSLLEGENLALAVNDIGFTPLKKNLDYNPNRIASCVEGDSNLRSNHTLPSDLNNYALINHKSQDGVPFRPAKTMNKKIVSVPGVSQMKKDKVVLNLVENVFLKCCGFVFSRKERAGGNCFRLVGSWILLPAHYASVFQHGTTVTLVFELHLIDFEWRSDRCYFVGEGQDLILVDCGPRVPVAPNNIKHFMTLEDVAHYNTSPGLLTYKLFSQKGSSQVLTLLDRVELTIPDTEQATVSYPINSGETRADIHIITAGLRYRALTEVGWCGALILRCDPKSQRKIMGIHTAASETHMVGYAEICCQEFLLATIQRATQDGITTIRDVEPSGKMQLKLKSEGTLVQKPKLVGFLGFVDQKEVPRPATKSQIRPSLLHGLIGPIQTEPSILTAFDTRLTAQRRKDGKSLHGKFDPIVDAVDKYGTPTQPFSLDKIEPVSRFLNAHFKFKDNSMNRRQILTYEEAINGIDGSDMWDQIEMRSSCGYPYVKQRAVGEIGKFFLFENVGEYESGRIKYESVSPLLDQNVEGRIEAAKEGKRYPTLDIECAKDERRKLKKIYDTVATRTFTNLPLDLNLCYRMYFLDFAVMVMEWRSKSFTKVGINPDSMEWTELMNNMLEKSRRGFAGDYAKFDGIGPPEIYSAIVDIINKWYDDGPENALIRQTLISECYNRVSIIRDGVVEITQGIPSGFSMTVIFNCFVNFYFLSMAWVDILKETPLSAYATPNYFMEYCEVATYGDDNVVAVCTDALPYYNLRTVAKWLQQYGITYTDDQKRPIEESEPHCDITETTFLKRSFVPDEKNRKIWKCPLDKVSVEEQIMWVRDSTDPQKAVRDNANNALYEASIHGKEYFEDLLARVNDAFATLTLDGLTVTYRDCRDRWKEAHQLNMQNTMFDDGAIMDSALRTQEFNESLKGNALDYLNSLVMANKGLTKLVFD